MKKFLVILIFLLLLTGCRRTDSILFKNEFEKYNTNSEYTKVSIPSDNPFFYITDDDLLEKIDNKEDMVVLFGYSKSNDTRNIIDKLIEVSKKENINKIYYLDILDIREDKDVNDNGEIVITKEGSSSYLKIIDELKDYVNEYIIKNTIVGNRIYAPSILVIKNKNIEYKNIKSYLDTEEDKNKDIEDMIITILEKYSKNSCDVNEGC